MYQPWVTLVKTNLILEVKFVPVGRQISLVTLKVGIELSYDTTIVLIFLLHSIDEASTKSALDEEGWFHTGDVGEVDFKGRFKIIDRVKVCSDSVCF